MVGLIYFITFRILIFRPRGGLRGPLAALAGAAGGLPSRPTPKPRLRQALTPDDTKTTFMGQGLFTARPAGGASGLSGPSVPRCGGGSPPIIMDLSVIITYFYIFRKVPFPGLISTAAASAYLIVDCTNIIYLPVFSAGGGMRMARRRACPGLPAGAQPARAGMIRSGSLPATPTAPPDIPPATRACGPIEAIPPFRGLGRASPPPSRATPPLVILPPKRPRNFNKLYFILVIIFIIN